jgi:FtsH-binding integral membrane protein
VQATDQAPAQGPAPAFLPDFAGDAGRRDPARMSRQNRTQECRGPARGWWGETDMTTLQDKVFLILGSQLGLTWLATVLFIRWLRRLYLAGTAGVSARVDELGELDIQLDWKRVKPYFWMLFLAGTVAFLGLLIFGREDLRVGIPLFCLWSVLTGIDLALALVEVDENIGARILLITLLLTVAAGAAGAITGVSVSWLEIVLLAALLVLLMLSIVRLFFSFARWVERFVAAGAVVLFSGWVYVDFHLLTRASRYADANSWPVAMDFAINIYLDVLNLFLHLLDSLSR